MRASGWSGLVVLLALVVSCDRSSSAPAPAASAPAASAPPLPSAPAPVALPAPADLDVDALKKKLGCGGTERPVCRVLFEFGAAARFEPRIPSGEGRWIGNAYALEQPNKAPELILLSASQVPTAGVPPGELPLHVGTGAVPEDKRIHAVKLANALARGDTVPKTNGAAPYVKSWKSSDAQGTMNTAGPSVRLVAQESYLRQSSGKVLLVQLKPAKGGSPEGVVAELWPSSW